MSDNLMVLREKDLTDNPTTRLPVCLCLDTSHSMKGESIDELNKGVEYFFNAIKDDEIACYSVELAVVSFNDVAEKISDFSGIDRQSPTLLKADGCTSMGKGVDLALDLLEQRKKEYSSKGVDYYQPWLVLMSDGVPTDDINAVVRRTQDLSNNKKLTVFSVAIGDNVGIDVLKQFSSMKDNRVLKVKSPEHFKEFFEWLSQSVSVASQSVPGDRQSLPPTPSVIEIEL